MKHIMNKRVIGLLLCALMLLTLLGGAPVRATAAESAQGTPGPGGPVVEVEDVNELISVIGPNVTLKLAPGEYDLASAASYGADTGNPYCHWEEVAEDGYELQIVDADSLNIRGAGVDETVILGKDRYASILSFSGCQGLTIADLTAGHSPMPGFCAGGVLFMQNCGDVKVEGCGLFGCGTVGVWASGCRGLTVLSTRIYECSDSAVNVDGCRDVTVQGCEIDHNSWRNEETIATSLFQAYDGDGFVVSGCRIHDNTANALFSSANTGHAAFLSNKVEYNTFYSAFALYGIAATVDGCSFHRNDIYNWYAEGFDEPTVYAQNSDGEGLEPADLEAMDIRPVQVREETPALQEPTEVAPGGRIVVTTVDEFLAAIGPDRTIVLQGEAFSLAKAANYGGEAGRYYRWEECYDGPQLVITGAADLTICAEGTDPAATTLTATPRYADVIAFKGCDNVTVSGLTLGHTDGPSECSGAVLNFENCVGITVDRCRLYGCGTMGVNASYARDLKVTDSEIYDCSISGAVLYGVRGAVFENCRVHDVPSPMLCLYDCSDVAWNGSPVLDTYYDVTPDGELVPVAIG